MSKIQKILKITTISIIILIIIISSLIKLNNFLRKEITLTEENVKFLEMYFPPEHIKQIKFYGGGVASWGSTRAIDNSIYFREKQNSSGRFFLENQNDIESQLLLIHEVFHTYQNNESDLSGSFLAQFRAYLKYGDRNIAYWYSLNEKDNIFGLSTNHNSEQEAKIIEDYVYLTHFNGNNLVSLYCFEILNEDFYYCDEIYSKEEIVKKLDPLFKGLMSRHKI